MTTPTSPARSRGLRVMKFGGSSVADGRRIAAVARIVASEAPGGALVVVSALGGVTDRLVAMIDAAMAGDESRAATLVADFAARHRDAALDLVLSRGELGRLLEAIEEERRRLSFRLATIVWSGGATAASRDEILAAGELLSSRLVASAIRAAGAAAVRIDPRELVVTDARHGAARPDGRGIAEAVAARLRPLLLDGSLVVTGGFVGRARKSGATTTLGRGGSDWTATILGAALPAALVEIWTDVDGLLTADPRVDPSARLIEQASFGEAEAMASAGAKVLHPSTVAPAREAGIPIRIRNTFRPDGTGTWIGPTGTNARVRRRDDGRSAGARLSA